MIEKPYEFPNISHLNAQEIINDILHKILGFHTKITELGKNVIKINYYKPYPEDRFSNINIILIRQDPDNKSRVIFKGILEESQILQIVKELNQKMNIDADSKKKTRYIMTKYEAIFEIIDEIEKKGYNIDTMDAIKLVDEFSEKRFRYPLYNEIESIVNIFISTPSRDFNNYGIPIKNDKDYIDGSFNQFNESKFTNSLNYEHQINNYPHFNQIEQNSKIDTYRTQVISHFASNEEIAEKDQYNTELDRLKEERFQRKKMENNFYDCINIEENNVLNRLNRYLKSSDGDITLKLISTIGPNENIQTIIVSKDINVSDLKNYSGELFGLNPENFYLSAEGIIFDEINLLNDYDIYDEMEILLIPASTAGYMAIKSAD